MRYAGGSQERFNKFTKSTSDGTECTRRRLVNGSGMRRTFVKRKEKRNRQGKDPRTFDENS